MISQAIVHGIDRRQDIKTMQQAPSWATHYVLVRQGQDVALGELIARSMSVDISHVRMQDIGMKFDGADENTIFHIFYFAMRATA